MNRRQSLKILTVGALAAFTTSCSLGDELRKIADGVMEKLDSIIKNLTLKMETISKDIATQTDRLLLNGDYALEHRLYQLKMVAEGMIGQIDSFVDGNQKNALNELNHKVDDLNKIVNKATASFIGVQDMATLDIQDLLNQIPFKQQVTIIRRVQGVYQSYREKGTYDIDIIGNGFKVGTNFVVKVNGKVLSDNLLVGEQIHHLTINIPADMLNSLFQEDSRVRVPLVISDTNGGKRPLLETKIVLMPKLPVVYSINGQIPKSKYSGTKKWTSEQERKMPPTGDYDSAPISYQMKVNAPKGSRFTGNFRKTPTDEEAKQLLAACSNPFFSEGDTIATVTCTTSKFDEERRATISLEYQEGEIVAEDLPLNVKGHEQGRLPFGDFYVDLPSAASSFSANFSYFNGQSCLLTAANRADEDLGISVRLENNPSNPLQRIYIKVGLPT